MNTNSTPRASAVHSVEFLKKEAKQWLKRLRVGDADAVARFNKALPNRPTPSSSITLRSVQHALAREHDCESWLALVTVVNARQRSLREIADEILKQAIFNGDIQLGARLFERHPEVAKLDLYCAVAAGDLDETKRRLAIDPSSASRAGGPKQWPPLLYLAYMRLPGAAPHSVEIARALLNAGAKADVSWNDDWANRFTALTGVIGLGEGVQPTHERADELVDLFVERGADPVDSQTFYNMSIVSDDTHWLEVLWRHSEHRGLTNHWREVSKNRIGGHRDLCPLDFMLSLAVSYGHTQRAEWLLNHGASANAKQAYSGRSLRDEALVYGNGPMADLLARHGASDVPPEGMVAFQVACRNLDRNVAQRLSRLHPEYLLDSEIMLTAARENRIEIVKLLLDLGVNVDVMNSGEVRALNLAAGFGSVELVELLIDRGADIDRPTVHYGGPMGFAAHFGRSETAAVIAPRSRDVHNLTFLGMKDRLRELFSAEPALVNSLSRQDHNTPLFSLTDDEQVALEMAKFLLDHGADPSIANKHGLTPVDAARKRGLNAVAELLSTALKKQ